MKKFFLWVGGGLVVIFVAIVIIGVTSDDNDKAGSSPQDDRPTTDELVSVVRLREGMSDFGATTFNQFIHCITYGKFVGDKGKPPAKISYSSGKLNIADSADDKTVTASDNQAGVLFQYAASDNSIYIRGFGILDKSGNVLNGTDDQSTLLVDISNMLAECK